MIGHHTSLLIQHTQNASMYLVSGQRNADDAWCYVSVPSAKKTLFQRALSQPEIDLAKFGQIIFSGSGATPPEEITRIIERYYIRTK